MKARSSITANTPENLLIDAGAVYLDYSEESERLLGATRGGNTWALNREIRTMEYDGAKGPTKGMKRIVSVAPVVTANLLELTKENLLLALPGAEVDETNPEYDKITLGDIGDGDYLTNIALVGNLASGDPVIIILYNTLAEGGLEIAMADQDEGVLTVEFTAHFDISEYDAEEGEWPAPFEIRYPKPY